MPLSAILSAAALLDSGINDAVYAEVVGHGEVWSARLMSAVLNQQRAASGWLDAREFYALDALRNRRLMKGFLTRCCNSYWYNIRANVWW